MCYKTDRSLDEWVPDNVNNLDQSYTRHSDSSTLLKVFSNMRNCFAEVDEVEVTKSIIIRKKHVN